MIVGGNEQAITTKRKPKQTTRHGGTTHQQPRNLILAGGPGVGKHIVRSCVLS